MDKCKSVIVWIASLIFGLGGWMVVLKDWTDADTPGAVGGLLMIIASITAPAFGGSIIKPNKGE